MFCCLLAHRRLPWPPDGHRFLPQSREAFLALGKEERNKLRQDAFTSMMGVLKGMPSSMLLILRYPDTGTMGHL